MFKTDTIFGKKNFPYDQMIAKSPENSKKFFSFLRILLNIELKGF